MGLIKAALGSAGGVLADQWKEYFYCESIPADILAVKGQKRTSGRSSNTKGSDNIITSGSIIAVADGQCMMIVEQGKVVEVCAEPGEFTFDASTEPSIFSGNLGESIGQVFQQIGKRFTFGGEAPKDQRVYYFNTKEIIGNKYGTASPVPFRVVDQRAGIDLDISIRCFGEYSYKLVNPLLFYTNVCGNVAQSYSRTEIDSQLKSELLTALQPAFARISEMGIRYSALPGHTEELSQALKDILSEKWRDKRGIEIGTVTSTPWVSSSRPSSPPPRLPLAGPAPAARAATRASSARAVVSPSPPPPEAGSAAAEPRSPGSSARSAVSPSLRTAPDGPAPAER